MGMETVWPDRAGSAAAMMKNVNVLTPEPATNEEGFTPAMELGRDPSWTCTLPAKPGTRWTLTDSGLGLPKNATAGLGVTLKLSVN